MDRIYIILMLILVIGMLFMQYQFLDRSQDGHESLKWLGMELALTVVLHLAALLVSSPGLEMLFQSMHFACINPMLLLLAHYICIYTGNSDWKKHGTFLRNLILVLTAADTVSILLNPVFGHAFSDPFFQASSAYTIRRMKLLGAGFAFHLAVSYTLLISMGWMLVRKVSRVEQFYRKKYFYILGLLVMAVFADFVYLVSAIPINLSMVVYILMLIGLSYLSRIYVPKSIMEETVRLTMREMNDGIICFDLEDNCVYANHRVYEFMGLPTDRTEQEELKEAFYAWDEKTQAKEGTKPYYVFEMPESGEERYYEVKNTPIRDRHENRIGICYTMYDRTEEVLQQRRESYIATIDALTGLYNRDTFYRKTAQLLQEFPDEEFTLIYADFQDFKLVNELFGIEKGNEILINFARILKEQWGENAICARIEDDHFVVCTRKVNYREALIHEGIELVSHLIESNAFRLQVYAGVYDITDRSLLVTVMCDRARMALVSVKGDYITRVGYYRDDLRKNVLYEKNLVSEFGEALLRGDFKMYLQPQADQDGRVDGAEALVRWEHPERGMIMPGVFINLFERTGTIAQLDCYIWEEACKKLKEWKILGFGEHYISVNISARDFSYVDVYETLTGLVKKYEIDPTALRLEITETALMSDFEKNLSLLERLQEYGFIVEIDDFGSGYSSLNMLKDIKADMLKIDMMFLRKTENEERSRRILRFVIDLAQNLGMSVLTEGVETKEQLDYLVKEGCDFFQGYYFEKPIPVIEFEKKYMGYGNIHRQG